MLKAILYFGLIFTINNQYVHAVEITKFTVPKSYVLSEDNREALILDCEYKISPSETGLVVKWLLDDITIYQWIPNKNPYSLGPMKKHIDTTFSASTNKFDRYRAVSILNPSWNMTGNYTCSVQTFQGMAVKTGALKIIHPETDFSLNTKIDTEGDDLVVTCSVDDVFPPPNLAILVNGAQLSIELKAEKDTKGPFDVTGRSKKALDEIESPATVTCILTIPETDYEKRKETVFEVPAPNIDVIADEVLQSGDASASLKESPEGNGSNQIAYWTLLHSTVLFILPLLYC